MAFPLQTHSYCYMFSRPMETQLCCISQPRVTPRRHPALREERLYLTEEGKKAGAPVQASLGRVL